MQRTHKEGALGRVVARLKEATERLLGKRRTPAPGQEQKVERELRETYDNPSDVNRARSGFRQ